MTDLKQIVIHGVYWRSLDRLGTQVVGFVTSVILARLLGPEEYGTIALLSIFLALAGVFVDSGFGMALVQKRDADDLDLNSIFYFNLTVSLLLYGMLWLAAPFIADFYAKPILIPVLRWSALILILNGVNSIQDAVLARNLKFNLSFWISLSGTLSQALIGIPMAYMGYGLWALVFGQLGSVTVALLVRWFLVGWRPSIMFSLDRVKSMFSFGSKILMAGLLDSFFNQIYGLLIGRWYSPAELAYFNRGDSIPNLVMGSVQGIIGGVSFPVLSKVQEEKSRVKAIMRRVMMTSTFLTCPAMFGLAAVAKPLVHVLLTDKWLPAVPFLQLACISYAFWPIHVMNLQVISACGRSDIFFKLEIIKKTLVIISLVATFKFGVLALAIGRVTLGPVCGFINAYPNGHLIDYCAFDQFKDLLPTFAVAAAVGAFALIPTLFTHNQVLLLGAQIGTGIIAFFLITWLFKLEVFNYLRQQISHILVDRFNMSNKCA